MDNRIFVTGDPRIDPERLVAKAREVAQQSRAPRTPGPRPSQREVKSEAWVGQVDQAIGSAERFWDVGVRIPPMHKVKGVLRVPATAMAKTMLRVAELITREQREFNRAALGALHSLRNTLLTQLRAVNSGLRDELDKRAEELSTSWNHATAELQKQVTALQQQQQALQQNLAELREEVARANVANAAQVGELALELLRRERTPASAEGDSGTPEKRGSTA